MLVTVHSSHSAPVMTRCQPQVTGWTWIIQNWNCVTWTPIPEIIKAELHLHHAVGICSGMILTQASANGLNELTRKLNKIGDKS